MNEACKHGNTGKLFRIIKSVSCKRSTAPETIKLKDGTMTANPEEGLNRWKEHFEELLNRQPPGCSLLDILFSGFLDITEETPTCEEVGAAIHSMRSRSAPGEDGLPPIVWKTGGVALRDQLAQLVRRIWRTRTVPKDWKNSVLVPIFKKGDKTDCRNYRGISLIDVAYKVLEAIILKRVRLSIDRHLRENQSGFRPGRSTVDQIFGLRRILELRWEYREPVIISFIDFKAAFDSVDHEAMYEILAMFGMPSTFNRSFFLIFFGPNRI